MYVRMPLIWLVVFLLIPTVNCCLFGEIKMNRLSQATHVHRISIGLCLTMLSAVSAQHWRVTDRQTDRQTNTASTALCACNWWRQQLIILSTHVRRWAAELLDSTRYDDNMEKEQVTVIASNTVKNINLARMKAMSPNNQLQQQTTRQANTMWATNDWNKITLTMSCVLVNCSLRPIY